MCFTRRGCPPFADAYHYDALLRLFVQLVLDTDADFFNKLAIKHRGRPSSSQAAERKGKINVGFKGNFGLNSVTPRTLLASHLPKMVAVEGIVTRATNVRHSVVESVHHAPKSGACCALWCLCRRKLRCDARRVCCALNRRAAPLPYISSPLLLLAAAGAGEFQTRQYRDATDLTGIPTGALALSPMIIAFSHFTRDARLLASVIVL